MRQSAVLEAAAALSTLMDVETGALAVSLDKTRIRMSDMVDVFSDESARAAAESDGNPTVYEYYLTEPSDQPDGALSYSSTVIHPGQVGGEFYMTKGHARRGDGSPEVCFTVRGEGMMLLQTDTEQIQALAMTPGTVLYIPGATSHRLVNTGEEPLVAFTVYSVVAARESVPTLDYAFKRIVVATPEGPDLVPNPAFVPSLEVSKE